MSVDDRQRRLKHELEALHAAYAADLPKKIATLRSQWRHVKRHPTEDGLNDLLRKAHSLAGSGATFGFSAVSDVAGRLEQALAECRARRFQWALCDGSLDRHFDDLASAAQEHPTFDLETPFAPPSASQTVPESCRILLIEKTAACAAHLSAHLGESGFEVHRLGSADDITAAAAGHSPLAVVMDSAALGDGRRAGRGGDPPVTPLDAAVPVVVVSDRDDMDVRLAAVRAGAGAFFHRSAEVKELIDYLHALACTRRSPSYRILIVDDDAAVAEHTAVILQRAGMTTRIVTKPMDIQAPLRTLCPDVILLDLYLPGCTGMELAAVIRQHCGHADASIVFFSVETDVERHIDSIRAGGDEFLVKPIEPAHLVAAVEARAKRTRMLRSLARPRVRPLA